MEEKGHLQLRDIWSLYFLSSDKPFHFGKPNLYIYIYIYIPLRPFFSSPFFIFFSSFLFSLFLCFFFLLLILSPPLSYYPLTTSENLLTIFKSMLKLKKNRNTCLIFLSFSYCSNLLPSPPFFFFFSFFASNSNSNSNPNSGIARSSSSEDQEYLGKNKNKIKTFKPAGPPLVRPPPTRSGEISQRSGFCIGFVLRVCFLYVLL